MEVQTQTVHSSAWAPLKTSLRPLLESIYPHPRRPTGLLTPTPISCPKPRVSPVLTPPESVHGDSDTFFKNSPDTETSQGGWGRGHAVDTPPEEADRQLGRRLSTEEEGGLRDGVTTWTEAKEKIIRSPYDYVAAEPGKEFRTMLLNAFNAWLEVPRASLDIIARVIRMLHTSSLLIDDIQDNSMLRRGRPVAHNVFGVAQTINAGNYVYFLALQELQKLPGDAEAVRRATEIYTSEMLYLHRGQGMDLYWRDTLTCPTEEDYLEMVSNKTGGLFRLAVKLMQSQSPHHSSDGNSAVDCVPLAEILGQAFQIADDYKNLANQDYTQLKGLCEDLTEGKFSFPIIHSVRSDPDNRELLHILAQRPTDPDIKRHAVRRMEATGSLDYTRAHVADLLVKARREADALDAGSGKARAMLGLLGKLDLK
ncbi:isoprenoid synthase domain-containing protein [Xylariaceae sp. FL0594]|nr:isoprenoid synthase domain-containing protein [Xylariaceae sp. FL0594]